MLEIWVLILKDFKDLCLDEEGNTDLTSQGTCAGVLKGLTFIYERLAIAESEIRSLQLPDKHSRPFIVGIKEATAKTMKYLSLIEASPIYYAAVFLDPNCRLSYFEDKWAPYDNRR